ncbi:MAG: dihydrofolate reductase [Legionella sp.]|nr:MAG: dihydrofolate reductase [Legionella sp.]PJE00144.1 MAG: dihydrofolate reductase [Legionella sp.]
MTKISLIAAIDEEQGIGKNNQLLAYLPADLQHFKKTTLGKPIIMGRKTYESIGHPLPGRQNIVISHHFPSCPDLIVASSITEALSHTGQADEVMIIGGAQLYQQTINDAARLYITKIHHRFSADVFFPLIEMSQWICKEERFHPRDERNPYDMSFCLYERITATKKTQD